MQLPKKIVDPWKGVPVLISDRVQLSVIDAYPEASVLLPYKQDWGSPGEITMADKTTVE